MDLVALCGVHDLVKGARGQRGNHLNDIVLFGAAGEDDLALWVSELAQSRGRHVKGHADFGAQHCCRHVDVLDIDEDPWSEPDLVEGAVVFSHRLASELAFVDWLR